MLIAALFTLTALAQDKINYLTTSEFEKAMKQEKQNCLEPVESIINVEAKK